MGRVKPPVLERWGRFVVRHRWATLVSTAVFIALAVALLVRGGPLTSGSFRDIESERAEKLVEEVTGHSNEVTFVAIFTAKQDAGGAAALPLAMKETLEPLRSDPRVSSVILPEDAPSFMASNMVDATGDMRLAYVTLVGTFPEALESYPEVRAMIASDQAEVTCTGHLPFMHDMNETLEADLVRAELIALPLALLVLVLVFRTLVAAARPVGVGGMAVVGGIGIVLGLSHVTDVAMYTINVCSLIGLGVSIDYSLFLVSRYREELAHGHPQETAIVRAVGKAGRVVLFSGVVVCASLAGLLFFSGSYLVTMGIGGAIVVALAVIFALSFLPALLSVLGPRIHAGRVPLPKMREDGQFWARVARGVMKRPLLVGLPTLGVLLAMGMPFLHLRLAAADVRVLDRTVEARRGYEMLRANLPEQSKNRIAVAVQFPTSDVLTSQRVAALQALALRAEAMPGVAGVESVFQTGMSAPALEAMLKDPPFIAAAMVEQGKKMTVGDDVALLYVLTDATPDSEAARAIVHSLRDSRNVGDGTIVVGGDTANDVDATEFIRSRMPRAMIFVIGVTLVLLFFLLRSVLLPIKAVLMNFLSMAGSFGALVWIFQDGHFGIEEPRPLEPTLPVLLFCILFGLSMDYEVLLLSRVREAYQRTGNNTEAVAEGLQKTAGLITSAAAIMVAVFIAFAFARVVMIQAVGVGMALAVALDATLVRTLLVPATMRLLGDLNWWSPRFARRDPPPPSARPITSH
jgi:putative drug exporter of the RND superfamily